MAKFNKIKVMGIFNSFDFWNNFIVYPVISNVVLNYKINIIKQNIDKYLIVKNKKYEVIF